MDRPFVELSTLATLVSCMICTCNVILYGDKSLETDKSSYGILDREQPNIILKQSSISCLSKLFFVGRCKLTKKNSIQNEEILLVHAACMYNNLLYSY